MIDLTDSPLQHNPFATSKTVKEAISELITETVNNLGRDPAITMFPDSDDQRDRLWQHIQDTPELRHLLEGEPADVEAAFSEVVTSFAGYQGACTAEYLVYR